MGIVDVILAFLANGAVAGLAQLDGEFAKTHREKLDQLKKRCDALISRQKRLGHLGIETLREIGAGTGAPARLARAAASDPVVLRDLTAWLMEPDPDAYDAGRAAALQKLADQCKCKPEELEPTVRSLEERLDHELGLSNWRQHEEHRLILQRLKENTDVVSELRRDVTTLLERSLNGQSDGALVRIDPTPQPLSSKNGLLTGDRPRLKDIAQGLDFRRNVYDRVMKDVKTATAPALFLFRGEAQIGKTTFMLRVGIDLAALGYPVFLLSSARTGERYADWIRSAAPELGDLPLVLLVDNAGGESRNFCSQMNSIHERDIQVVVLATERNEVLKRGDDDKAFESLAIDLDEVDLGNAEGEATKLLDRLVDTNIVELDEAARAEVLVKVKTLAGGPRYFARVMEIASKHRPVPQVVAEALTEAGDDANATAFRRLYRLTCVTGVVGVSLPEEVVVAVLDLTTITTAMKFAESLAAAPIRMEENCFAVTHETHADTFMEFENGATDWKVLDSLRDIINAAVARPEQTAFLGGFFEALRVRGMGEAAVALWDEVADRMGAAHWQTCGANSLTQVWGAFFNHSRRRDAALQVTRLACEKAPDHAVAHNNYALLLNEIGEEDEARKHYKKALEINPRYAEAHYNYALHLKQIGEKDEARKHYEKALEINPRYAEAHDDYAILLEVIGEKDEARKHYEKALEINPRYAEAAANLAHLLLGQGEILASLDHAASAIRLGTLPDRGTRVIGWFAKHTEALRGILQSGESSDLHRGTTAFLLLALKDEKGEALVESLWEDPTFSGARAVAEELRRAVSPADGEADSQESP